MSILAPVAGRILDGDSHEVVPARLWTEVFGESTAGVAQLIMQEHLPDATTTYNAPVDVDDAPVETAHEARQRFSWAPGAIDMPRRVDVMDVLGVAESFIFPGAVGFMGINCLNATPEQLKHALAVDVDLDADMLTVMGKELLRVYNDWCIRTAQLSPRLRPVAFISTHDMRETIAEIERLVQAGIRAIGISSAICPDGKSPGDPALDPLWATFAENNVPILFHAGQDFGFLQSPTWADYVAGNAAGKYKNPEIVLDPYSVAQMGASPQNFLTVLIYGGVLERHPTLRIGFHETTAYWLGPMSENMEYIGRQFRSITGKLSLTPAEYIARHVRVTPFHWEPIDQYIDRFGLEDIYIYGSDYPHPEGGKNPAEDFAARLQRHGPEAIEKFFVKNARLLMP